MLNRSNLGNKNTSTTGGLNLFFGTTREEASLDDDWLGGQNTLAQNLSISSLQRIDDGDGVTLSLCHGQRKELFQVHNGAMMHIACIVEMTHTQLSKESGMEAIKVGAVVSKTSSLSATSWMLTVFSNTTVTGGDVATELPGLFQFGNLQGVSIR